jgi:uncharacterized protein (DUF2384 family)
MQIYKLLDLSFEVFRTFEESWEWLNRPSPLLNGEPPIEHAQTKAGFERVRTVLDTLQRSRGSD